MMMMGDHGAREYEDVENLFFHHAGCGKLSVLIGWKWVEFSLAGERERKYWEENGWREGAALHHF